MTSTDDANSQAAADAEVGTTDLQADLIALRADLQALAGDVSALGRNQITRARSQASEFARAGNQAIEDMEGNLIEAVRERPLQSLALAFGLGYVVAMFNRD